MVNTMLKFFYIKPIVAGIPATIVPSWSAPADS
jgi:hypothetical protein